MARHTDTAPHLAEYLTLVEDCVNRQERLTDWETNFIDSISRRLSNNQDLSPKQIEVLDRIWEKVTKHG